VKNFPKISTVVTFFEEFPRNFSRNSPELVPKMRDFCGSQFWDSVSRNSWEIPRNFSPGNSSEFLQNSSPEIPEKFLGLNNHVYRFLGAFIKWISFEKFLGISPELHLKKILRISPDYFSGNSWEILRTWAPCLRILRGIY